MTLDETEELIDDLRCAVVAAVLLGKDTIEVEGTEVHIE